ncbi:MAG: hypothetical protein JNL32_14455 [Candidatus Kapabacteria bacterium]|nr:hypothetical protein [Candidatus Kapabacteria bacterium]
MPDLSSVPLGAMLLVAAGWAVAPLAGGAVAMWLGGEKGTYCMWAVAALFAIVVIINLLQFHHPVWMWVVGILAPVPAALLGGRLIKRR